MSDDPFERLRRRTARIAPETEPEAAGEPVVAAEPVVEPEPVLEPEPVVETEPEPAVAAEPMVGPEPVVAPELVVAPEPVLESVAPESDLAEPTPTPVEPQAAPPTVEPVEPAIEALIPNQAAVGPKRGIGGVAVLAVIAVLVAALLAVSLAVLSNRRHVAGGHVDAAPIIASAVTGITDALSYNYKSLPSDFATAEQSQTPAFGKVFAAQAQSTITPSADKTHTIVKATIDPRYGAGIISQSGDVAKVLLYVDQTTTNNLLPSARLDQSRVIVKMQYLGGKWLISNFSGI